MNTMESENPHPRRRREDAAPGWRTRARIQKRKLDVRVSHPVADSPLFRRRNLRKRDSSDGYPHLLEILFYLTVVTAILGANGDFCY